MSYCAVIGANWGDEGKGLTTDYLSRSSSTLVVRFNGGAQAGHTVITPQGVGHEFHHLGAGSFCGAHTLLGRHFLVNPPLFAKEWSAFAAKSTAPLNVFVDPYAMVTTPWDMLLNQEVELARDTQKHGSCGLGINETVTRSLAGYPLTVEVLTYGPRAVRTRLLDLLTHWYPGRAQMLGVVMPVVDMETYLTHFQRDVETFLAHVQVAPDQEVVRLYQDLVFEGAQGLRLDECSPDFPHVTRSRTGLTNVVQLLKDAKLADRLVVYYVTRSYFTRHGRGPLPGECEGHPYGWTGDETNTTNRWQDHLRYAPLDPVQVIASVQADMASSGAVVVPRLAITCIDHMRPACHDPIGHLQNKFAPFHVPIAFMSEGPTREDVIQLMHV